MRKPKKWTAEYTREYMREYRIANKEKVRARINAWKRANPSHRWAENLRRAFGITLEQYDAMLKAQGGRCAICREEPKRVRLAVDHDHETGAIRGLLCIGCNTTIGKLRDSPHLLEQVGAYLRRHSQLKLVS